MRTIDDIKLFLRARPFVPFDIKMSNGESIRIEVSDYVIPNDWNVMIGYDLDNNGWPTRSTMLGVDQIASIEQVRGSSPPREPGFEGDPFKRPGED